MQDVGATVSSTLETGIWGCCLTKPTAGAIGALPKLSHGDLISYLALDHNQCVWLLRAF